MRAMNNLRLLLVSCLTTAAARTAAGGKCAVHHRITLSASAPQQLLLLRGGTTSSNSEEGANIASEPNASAAVANGTVSSATIAIAPSAIMWLEMRFSSQLITRRYCARFGTSMPISFSHALAQHSFANIAAT